MPTMRSRLKFPELLSPVDAREALEQEVGDIAPGLVCVFVTTRARVAAVRAIAQRDFGSVYAALQEVSALNTAARNTSVLTLAARPRDPEASPFVSQLEELEHRSIEAYFGLIGVSALAQRQIGVDVLDFAPGRRGRRKGMDWRIEAASLAMRLARACEVGPATLTQRTLARVEIATGSGERRPAASLVRAWEHARRRSLVDVRLDRQIDRFTFQDRRGRVWAITQKIAPLLAAIEVASSHRELQDLARSCANLVGAEHELASAAYANRRALLEQREPKEIKGEPKQTRPPR